LRIARHASIAAMLASLLYMVLRRLLTLVAPKHRSDDVAQIEIFVLRHQLQVLRRQVKRPVYRHGDRALLAAASRILPKERWGAFLVRPETLLRWHRSLVARKWTRPHRPPGRPAIDPEVCKLILQMARENPRWGYMRIKGELGKLGIRVSATSVAMLLRRSGVARAASARPARQGLHLVGTVCLPLHFSLMSSLAIFSWSLMMPCSSASGRGGHPGT
jgi:putative transposase